MEKIDHGAVNDNIFLMLEDYAKKIIAEDLSYIYGQFGRFISDPDGAWIIQLDMLDK